MKQVRLPSDWKKFAGLLLVLLMFLAALYFLHREFEPFRWNDFVQSIRNLPLRYVLSAIGLTVLNYGMSHRVRLRLSNQMTRSLRSQICGKVRAKNNFRLI